MAHVARHLGVTRAWVYQLETEHRRINSENLSAFAELYGFTPAFFRRPAPIAWEGSSFNFRSLRSTTKRERDKARATAAVLVELVETIEAEIELPPVTVPTLNASDFKSIEEATYECRSRWGIGIDLPVKSVTRLLETLGIVVTTIPLISEKIDAFSVSADRPLVVHGLRARTATRARMDLAHELAHLVLHQETGNDPSRLADQEFEADSFAGALLLPRIAFIRSFPRDGLLDWSVLLDMKRHWGASLSAIISRAWHLELITDLERSSAYRQIAMKWGRLNEPGEPPLERPELFESAIKLWVEGRTGDVTTLAESRMGWRKAALSEILPAA